MSQQRKPDVGIGYKATYTDKSGAEQTYLKLMIRVDQLAALDAGDGMIRLSVFPQLGEKKKENSPDFTVKPTLTKGKQQAVAKPQVVGRANVAAAANSGNKFPF